MRGSAPVRRCLIAAAGLAFTGAMLAGLPASRADTVEIRMGQIFNQNVPIVRCGAIPLSENERLKTLGFDITVIHSAQLGSENELVQQVSSGQLEMTNGVASILAAWVEDLSVFETYYLYSDVDDVFRAYETEVARALWQELREVANIRAIGFPWLYGERHVFGSRALRAPADFEGLRMRVPETSVSIEGARSLGASPTPTAYAELYLALQQGIVDAAEAPASVAHAESFHEPADYFNLTGHLITASPVIINEDLWQSLSAEQQEALETAVVEAAHQVRACVEEQDEAAYAAWRTSGEIEIVDDVDRDALMTNARAYFSEGFSWSESYSALVKELDAR